MRDFLDRGAAVSVEARDSAMTLAQECRAGLAEAFARCEKTYRKLWYSSFSCAFRRKAATDPYPKRSMIPT
jgi:hypothetical protein